MVREASLILIIGLLTGLLSYSVHCKHVYRVSTQKTTILGFSDGVNEPELEESEEQANTGPTVTTNKEIPIQDDGNFKRVHYIHEAEIIVSTST